MKKQDLDRLLAAACEDQRADLRVFAETGDQDALARIHFDACVGCDRMVEKIIELRDGMPPAPEIASMSEGPSVRERAFAIAFVGAVGAMLVAIVFSLGYLVYASFREDADAKSEIGRLDRRVIFVRLPGHPEVCVASLRGVGGYGPRYLGAAPCALVKDRVESDEDLAWHLRDYAVVRMRDTDVCLVRIEDGEDRFTVPCATFGDHH